MCLSALDLGHGLQSFVLLQGKPTEESKSITVKQYGELKTTDFVPGTEVQCFYVYTSRLVLSLICAIS